jgi:hypothetical protein
MLQHTGYQEVPYLLLQDHDLRYMPFEKRYRILSLYLFSFVIAVTSIPKHGFYIYIYIYIFTLCSFRLAANSSRIELQINWKYENQIIFKRKEIEKAVSYIIFFCHIYALLFLESGKISE